MAFGDGRQYVNVYFLFVDAKGHSTFVRENDEENVFRAFDRLEDDVRRSYDDAAKRESCGLAERWGWLGDGGLVVFYDESEGNARRAALRAGEETLKAAVELNRWITDDPRINGTVHLRLAIHKGSLTYRGEAGSTGSIHSTAINLAAHAEKNAPTDSLVVSEAVFLVSSGEERRKFIALTPGLEGETFYVATVDGRTEDELVAEWRANVAPGIAPAGFRSDIALARLGVEAIFSQRAATSEYAELIEGCSRSVAVLGTTLGGFTADHTDLIMRRVEDGVRIRVLLPSRSVSVRVGATAVTIPGWRAGTEGAQSGAADREWQASADFFERLAASRPESAEVRYYTVPPAGAVMIVDDVVYFSPMLSGREGLKTFTLALRGTGLLAEQVRQYFETAWTSAERESES